MLSLIDVVVPAEADKPERFDPEKVRYSAHLPWIGPVLGPAQDGGQTVTIGGVADPRLGNAVGAVLIPVVERGERYEPADRAGQPADLVEVAWFEGLESDEDRRFRLRVPAGLWDGTIAGVLILLLYERSGRVSHRLDKLLTARDLPEKMIVPIRSWLTEPERDRALGLIVLGAHPAPDTLTFAFGSCQYPAGFLDRDIAERSYGRLASLLDDPGAAAQPACVLLLGDQVYLDATAGLFDPTTIYDKYHQPYERLLHMKALRHVLRRIPAHMMLDDHEIEDNWERIPGDRSNDEALVAGRDSYLAYQRIAGPEPGAGLWYPFEVNGFPFFLTDTRTERDPRTVDNIERAQIVGSAQFTGLLEWLAGHKQNSKPKFIASSVSLLPRHRRATCSLAGALRSDAWDGYPASLHRLLASIVEQEMKDVVFLSGDEHISFVARAVLRRKGSGKAAVIHSIHSSALYAPYPFANSIDDHLQWEDFEFDFQGATYTCEVSKCLATTGDGISVLKVDRAGKEWKLDYRFLRADDPQADVATVICTSR